MSKRVTIVVSDENHKKLRSLQSKKIKKTNMPISFSEIVNNTLRSEIMKK